MNFSRLLTLVFVVGVWATAVFVAYDLFWGPGRIDLAGKSLADIINSGLIVPLLAIALALILMTNQREISMPGIRSVLLLGATAFLVSACGEIREDLGLGRNVPDEFAVVEHPPLSMPPDFSLRPPRPGAWRSARRRRPSPG